MPGIVCIGAQWGDEGKGKIVDILSEKADMVIRYAGGNNAGHTVIVGDDTYILHLIPSGIIRKGKMCLLGNGVVIDPIALFSEIDILLSKGIHIGNNLMISQNAHVIMPYHRILDGIRENGEAFQKIGTTRRGIGPCYVDKAGRTGIRIIDLIDKDIFTELVKMNLAEKNAILEKIYGHEPLKLEDILNEYIPLGEKIKPFVVDGAKVANDALSQNLNVLFEGAQGALLDVDFGTYPYVTSSNSGVTGVCSGTGVPPTRIDRIIGVAKAYCTRVGEGPFPSELPPDENQLMRERGDEYGATTGRPRRCGWFDLVSSKLASRVNGLTEIVLTKLDVLDQCETISICTGYSYKGEILREFPIRADVLWECKPVYEQLPGWMSPTTDIRKRADLPVNALKYIERIEQELNVPVKGISVGSKRDQTMFE